MAAKLLVLLACLALSRAALVKREATGGVLDDLQKHATEFQKTFSEQLAAISNSQNSQSLNNALTDGTNTVLTQLTAFTSSLEGAAKDASGKAKEALELTKANIERTAEELRNAHPEVEQHANTLKDKLQAAVQAAAQETQKLAKEIASNVEQTNQKLAPKVQEAFNDFVKQAQEVQKKVQDAVAKQ